MLLHKRLALLVPLVAVLGAGLVSAAEPQAVSPQEFDKLHQMIKPQAGESRFWQIPWLLDLDEALQMGAAQGKPIFVWSGAGGAPHTVC